MLFEFIDKNNTQDNKLVYSDSEGLEKGNMFKSLYNQYKNYEPAKLTPHNDKEALLLKIQQLSFALNDLNLYLDLYPKDEEMYNLFVEYSKSLQVLMDEYESKYQVLEVCHDTFGEFTWSKTPWPWGGLYV